MSELIILMNLFYDIKDKLSDNEYKSGVELLQKMYKKYPNLVQEIQEIDARQSTYELCFSAPKLLRILNASDVDGPRLATRVRVAATNDLTTFCPADTRQMVTKMMTRSQLTDALIRLATSAYINGALRSQPTFRSFRTLVFRTNKNRLIQHALQVFTFHITIN